VITGYRKIIGDYMMGVSYGKLLKLKSVLTAHTSSINAAYEDLLRKNKGAYMPSKLPSWEDPSLFWLDDHMPLNASPARL
jgi:hypothetical protein